MRPFRSTERLPLVLAGANQPDINIGGWTTRNEAQLYKFSIFLVSHVEPYWAGKVVEGARQGSESSVDSSQDEYEPDCLFTTDPGTEKWAAMTISNLWTHGLFHWRVHLDEHGSRWWWGALRNWSMSIYEQWQIQSSHSTNQSPMSGACLGRWAHQPIRGITSEWYVGLFHQNDILNIGQNVLCMPWCSAPSEGISWETCLLPPAQIKSYTEQMAWPSPKRWSPITVLFAQCIRGTNDLSDLWMLSHLCNVLSTKTYHPVLFSQTSPLEGLYWIKYDTMGTDLRNSTVTFLDALNHSPRFLEVKAAKQCRDRVRFLRWYHQTMSPKNGLQEFWILSRCRRNYLMSVMCFKWWQRLSCR